MKLRAGLHPVTGGRLPAARGDDGDTAEGEGEGAEERSGSMRSKLSSEARSYTGTRAPRHADAQSSWRIISEHRVDRR